MALIINQCSNEIYYGALKVATSAVKPGMAVVADYSAGTAAVAGTDGAADGYGLHLVCNYDSYADTDMTASKDFEVAVGKYLRLKQFQVGDIFTTDQFAGTYGSISVDDIFAVDATGVFEAIASRTPVVRVQVIAKTTIYGENALQFRVIAA